MSIRDFEDESYICGWFNQDGKLIDIRQYSTPEMAMECAKNLKSNYRVFIGQLGTVPSDSGSLSGTYQARRSDYLGHGEPQANRDEPNKSEKIGQYLYMLFEAQKADHNMHSEIDEALKQYKAELAI